MRRSLRWKLILVVLLAVFAAGWAFVYEPLRLHREWDDAMRANIKSLADKRPTDVTPQQWEYTVGWTINLHANCGAFYSFSEHTADPAWRDGFRAELERRLQGPITLADIDWIWDEYAKNTKHGHKYSDQFRPTRGPNVYPKP